MGAATGAAFAITDDDQAALNALAVLDGFNARGPLATALLCAAYRETYGVMDRRRIRAPPGPPSRRRGFGHDAAVPGVHQGTARRPAVGSGQGTTACDIDKALHVPGGPS